MAIHVALGSNLGDRLGFLRRAVERLEARGVEVVRRSSIYETAPVGMASRLPFLNAVAEVRTDVPPGRLLTTLLDVEHELGRRRDGGPRRDRTCDLDLLLYGDLCRTSPALVLPHPRIAARRFVLLPLLEIAPDLRDPATGEPFADAAKRLAGREGQACEVFRAADAWGDVG